MLLQGVPIYEYHNLLARRMMKIPAANNVQQSSSGFSDFTPEVIPSYLCSIGPRSDSGEFGLTDHRGGCKARTRA